ncbi:glycosyl hydrolase 53 family protein [uncultured Subdoligranulum sp.]|uniref:glycosyl hydrolase 53 family protein n=1 Tax=uncultured Subdoligranulum sp. TaxID=512298 RepID=UPI0025EA4327|nr:glycosyl hydrolase 53 family protein [uncultured Subdoligranulum sp.]
MKKYYGVRRIFSILLALAMLLVLAPAAAAQETSVNLLQDGSFDQDIWGGDSPWTCTAFDSGGEAESQTVIDRKDPDGGDAAMLHWRSPNEATVTVSQTVTLEAGNYTMRASAQGEKCDALLFCGSWTGTRTTLTGYGSWDTLEETFTVEAAGAYNVGVTLPCTPNGWGCLDGLELVRQEEVTPPSTGEPVYTVELTADTNRVTAGDTVHLSAVVCKDGEPVTDLAAEGLYLWFWADQWQAGHEGAPVDAVFSNYDKNSGHSLTADATLPGEGTYYLAAELKTETERLDIAFAQVDAAAEQEPQEPAPDPVEAEITVPYVAGSDGEFIRGVDVSSLLSLLNSGVVFRDAEGNPLGDSVESQGKAFMTQLADAGVNWVRLRVWNDPFTAEGQGYGGGNNDLKAAEQMGRWATEAGLQVLIDFHYSDFWADPGKQQAPKAWKDMTVDEKAAAVSTFTTESLRTLLNAGVNVGMVQIGNETNNGIAGVMYRTNGWDAAAKLFAAGVDAAHAVADEYNTTILAAVHFTNPERGNYVSSYAANLDRYNVDYDVFASSYYPYWHGTLENLTGQLKQVADTYGKKVMVAETSWATTLEDGDGHDNTVRVGQNDDSNMSGKDWAFSVQGQASEVADVARAVTAVGDQGIGLFYWEPAWQPVHNVSGLEGEAYEAQVAANRLAWEQYGSGWASSYAGEYDPNDAGEWFGGSAVDNQAMFDFDGKPLASLYVWKLMQTGSVAPKKVESADNPVLTVEAGSDGTAAVTLPDATTVYYSDGTSVTAPVVWETAGLDLNALPAGSYTVQGTATATPDGTQVTVEVQCTLTVVYPNLLENPGFEEGAADYTLSENWPGHGITGNESGNLHSGSQYLHFYSASECSVTVQHSPVTLQPGRYTFTLYMQGADVSGRIFVTDGSGSELAAAGFAGTQWGDWQQPALTFTLTEETVITPAALLDIQPGGWGAVDDLYLGKLGDQAVEPTPDTPQEDNLSTPVQNQQTITVSSTSKPAAAAASEPAAAATGTVGAIPQTGDTLPVAVLALLMVLSAAAMLGIALLRRKE